MTWYINFKRTGIIVWLFSMDNHHFLGKHSVVVCNHEEVNAFCVLFHVVFVVITVRVDNGFEGINLVAGHVEHLDGSVAFHVLEVDVHLSVVGVRHDVDLGRRVAVFFNVKEG